MWTGNPGKTRLSAGTKPPPAEPGDSAKETTALTYDVTTGPKGDQATNIRPLD